MVALVSLELRKHFNRLTVCRFLPAIIGYCFHGCGKLAEASLESHECGNQTINVFKVTFLGSIHWAYSQKGQHKENHIQWKFHDANHLRSNS